MTAIQNLENDHVNILRLIASIEKMVKVKHNNFEHLDIAVNLIKNYADGFHHAKEEDLLFPLMVKRGFSTEQGPIAVMLHEHTLGRNYVKAMTEALISFKKGSEDAINEAYKNMISYCSLLRNHIDKENNVLFKMADNALNTGDQESLIKEFERVEKSNYCGGQINNCLDSISKLETISNTL